MFLLCLLIIQQQGLSKQAITACSPLRVVGRRHLIEVGLAGGGGGVGVSNVGLRSFRASLGHFDLFLVELGFREFGGLGLREVGLRV